MADTIRAFISKRTRHVAEGPSPLVREIESAEPYPLEALGPLRSAVEAIQDHTQAPAAISAQAVLGAASLVTQAHADVVLPTGQTRPTSLFLLTIATSGERKSAVDALALKPIYAREADLRESHERELGAYNIAYDVWEARRNLDELTSALSPVGSLELILTERIAITIWRQRRLIVAETASLRIARQPHQVARVVPSELHRTFGNEIKAEDLDDQRDCDSDPQPSCRTVLAEIGALEEVDLRSLATRAPTTFEQLRSDAEGQDPEKFLTTHPGGLDRYLADLVLWCHSELKRADDRLRVLSIAEPVRTRAKVPKDDVLDLFTRYQVSLDNQLYKALRALREAEDWRLKSLDGTSEQPVKANGAQSGSPELASFRKIEAA